MGERTVEVRVAALEGGRYEVTIDGQARVVDARTLGERAWSLIVDGAVHTVDVAGELPDVVVHFRDHSVRFNSRVPFIRFTVEHGIRFQARRPNSPCRA